MSQHLGFEKDRKDKKLKRQKEDMGLQKVGQKYSVDIIFVRIAKCV